MGKGSCGGESRGLVLVMSQFTSLLPDGNTKIIFQVH
jgi:hypothetical protein